jgi:KaiC/GvpD/RAD55 family RecA-like ATPase
MAIDGPAGSGKTYTALRFAHALANGGRIAVIDTERGSASKYVGEAPDGIPWQFDVAELATFSPEKYAQLVEMASRSGYDVLVIDSLSHAWEGKEGALEIKQKIGDSWSAWRHVTPIHNRMIDTILQAPLHVITTMRSRIEYVQEQDDRGKTVIRKVGMSPIQRPGVEYEWDIVCDIDYAHIMTVSKSRCSAVADMTLEKPGPDFMRPVIEWLTSGNPSLPVADVPAQEPVVAPDNIITLDMLLDAFTPETILEANDGKLPENDAEVLDLAKRLGVA